MMYISQRGLAEIAAHEAIVLSPYLDSVGKWTVGIGHTASAGKPNPATERRDFSIEEIMGIFARDIELFEERVRSAFTRTLTQAQFDAAVSFDFNTGGIKRATWVKQFNNGDMAKARKSFMAWRKPPEIIPRREKERDLFFDGNYSGDGHVSVYPATRSGKVQWKKGQRVLLTSYVNEEPKAEGTYQGPDSETFPEVALPDNVSYSNKNAIRNLPVTETLEIKISKAVNDVFGSGFRAEIYSGGQPRKGSIGKRTGSIRHDDQGNGGRAADIYIYNSQNNRVRGERLAPLGQYWLANKLGGCGMVMNGGGVHLDEWATPPRGGGMFWTYKASDSRHFGQAIKKALGEGYKGIVPDLAPVPPKQSEPPQNPGNGANVPTGALVGGAVIVSAVLEKFSGWMSNSLSWIGGLF